MLNLQRDTNTIFKDFIDHPNFVLIEGDIRNIADCNKAVAGVDYVLHRCSVPRSIKDPITTNDVMWSGF
jgi:UDP-N-acetylglucosamine 4-epimerase